jgi:glycogen(starch) synthase
LDYSQGNTFEQVCPKISKTIVNISLTMKIMYVAGSGNIIGTFDYWKQGQDDPSQVAITYSSQFYDVCSTLNAKAYIISSYTEKQYIKDKNFILENRPILLSNKSGVLYHLGHIIYGLSLIISALKFKPDCIIIFYSQYAFILSILSRFGIEIVPTVHSTLWNKNSLTFKKIQKLFLHMNKVFLFKKCLAIISISEDINQQIKDTTDNQQKTIFNFLPTYRKKEFSNIAEVKNYCNNSKFQVLFIGRIEANKGVFDILEIAKQFKIEEIDNIAFQICGDGSALELLSQRTKEEKIDPNLFIFHGHCNKSKVNELLNLSHILIVPTTNDFAEGFNKVVAEAILANRPSIVSSACPAVLYVKDAIIEVSPGDIKAYCDAILELKNDHSFYLQKIQHCKKYAEQFYDKSKSWGEVLKLIINQVKVK